MDNQEVLPFFDSFRPAINSGYPFRLTNQARSAQIRLEEIPEDRVILLHNALLCDNLLRWTVNNERDLKFITKLLKEHSALELLNLYMNITINADDELISVLQTCQLAGLHLSRTANVDVDPILRALQHQKNLKKLQIFFGPNTHEYEGLACAVSNPNLLDFDLCADEATDLGMWTALEPVLLNHASLKSLNIWYAGGHIGHSLNKVFSGNQSIRHLTLSDYYHRINATDMELLWSGLTTNKVLQEILFSYCEEGAASKIFEIMAQNKCHVPTIKFIGVIFSDDNMKALNMALKTNTTVVELSIQDSNVFSPHREQLLCDGLVQNNSLKTLRLAYDEYDMASVSTLFNAVAQNNGLQVLKVLGNNTTATDELSKATAQMLAKNKSLTKIIMASSAYNYESMLRIFEALASNTALRSIELAYDKSEVVSSRQLSDALQENQSLDDIEFCGLQDDGLVALVQRNRLLKSEVKFKIAILSHNIARSRQALTTLPREIWIGVLSMVTHPGLEPFHHLVQTIFDSYTNCVLNRSQICTTLNNCRSF